MGIFAALALSVCEDIGIGLAALGAYFVLSGERPWPGAALAVGSLLYSVIMKMVLMPHEGGGASFLYMYEGIIPKGETGAGGILKTVLGNTGYLAHQLLTGDRFTYLLQILVPVLLAQPPGSGCLGNVYVHNDRLHTSYQRQILEGDRCYRYEKELLEVDMSDPRAPVSKSTAVKGGWLMGVQVDVGLLQSGWSNRGLMCSS